jgi:hypothetical protein
MAGNGREDSTMPFTRCPSCRKVMQVDRRLLNRDVGCMDPHCGKTFKAEEYRLHSNWMSRTVFWFTIGFAVFMLIRWVWLNAKWIAHELG